MNIKRREKSKEGLHILDTVGDIKSFLHLKKVVHVLHECYVKPLGIHKRKAYTEHIALGIGTWFGPVSSLLLFLNIENS
jgi:hypothetical protein